MTRWSRIDQAGDRSLAKGLRDASDATLAEVYDRYAERLYDFCEFILADTRAAADVVHDTIIDCGQRSARMRHRELLGPWLYGNARRRCLSRKSEQVRAAESAQESDPLATALAALGRTRRHVLFLSTRHRLTTAEIAVVLGISPRQASAHLAKARGYLRQAIGVDADGLPPGARLNLMPAPVLPASLRHRVLHTGADPELGGFRDAIAARGGVLNADGFPRQPGRHSRLAGRWVATLTVLSAAMVAVVALGGHLPVQEIRDQRQPVLKSPSVSPDVASNPFVGGRPVTERQAHGPTTPPTASPTDSGTPSPQLPQPPPPPTGPGSLIVAPDRVRLQTEATASLTLTAVNGPVTWEATGFSERITLSATRGMLAAGASVTVLVRLHRSQIELPGTTSISVADETESPHTIRVTWKASLL